MTTAGPRPVRGFSIVEAVLSTLVIGVMLVAVLNAVGGARAAQAWNADRLRATALASDLLAEIVDKAYRSPSGNWLIGPEADEVLALAIGGARSNLDDVDDYENWSESPPANANRTAIPGYSGWTRSVRVAWVNLNDPRAVSASPTGLKRITVTVRRKGVKLAELTALRALGVTR
jgi:type II secretory pathway pseudopilin PulG